MISHKAFAVLFHIAHTHPSGGVDVPFLGCDLRPNFLPLILRPLLTLIDGRRKVHFPVDSLESVSWIVWILPHKSIRGCRCAFWGVVTFDLFFNL